MSGGAFFFGAHAHPIYWRTTLSSPVLIVFGIARLPTDVETVGNSILIPAGRSSPVRLNSGLIQAEQGAAVEIRSPEQQLAAVEDAIGALCSPWAKHARGFVAAYFRFIAASIARHEPEIAEQLRPHGDVFAPSDFAFSALLPIPQAHILTPHPDGGWKARRRADFALVSGTEIVAINVGRHETRAPCCDIALVDLDLPAGVEAGGLLDLLPAGLSMFWRDAVLPCGTQAASFADLEPS